MFANKQFVQLRRALRLQQPPEQRYPVLQVHAASFCVSVIHRSSDMVSRIFNVRTYVIIFYAVRIKTRGIEHTDSESEKTFLTRGKLSQFVLVLLMEFEPPVFAGRI